MAKAKKTKKKTRRQDPLPEFEIPCPCGYVHQVMDHPTAGTSSWLTIRDRDYPAVLDAEIRLMELHAGGNCGACDEEDAAEHCGHRHDDACEHPESAEELNQSIIERCAPMLECPECGRLMWSPPGEGPLRRVYTLEQAETPTEGRASRGRRPKDGKRAARKRPLI